MTTGLLALWLAQAPPVGLQPRCLTSAGAGRVLCRAAAPASARSSGVGAALGGAYVVYRSLNAVAGAHRRCRLEPTCSLFAVQAVERFGFWSGLLAGLARLQMEHGDQGGLLAPVLGSDGLFLYRDPVARWGGAP